MNLFKKNVFEDIENIKDDSPLHSVIMFFSGWRTRSINMMLNFSSPTWKSKPRAKEKLELWFNFLTLKGMQIVKIKRINDTNYKVALKVGWTDNKINKTFVKLVNCDVVCEKGVNDESINGNWFVRPVTLLHTLGIFPKVFVSGEEMESY